MAVICKPPCIRDGHDTGVGKSRGGNSGYLLVAFEASSATASEAVAFYLVAYFITTIGAFGVVTVLSEEERDADTLEDYAGLFWRRPMLAGIFTLMLLSLKGILITAGFLAKFYVVAAGASAGMWALILILVVTSVIGLFYYLRVVVAMYARIPEKAPRAKLHAIGGSYSPGGGYDPTGLVGCIPGLCAERGQEGPADVKGAGRC